MKLKLLLPYLLLLFLINSSAHAQCLSGVYTIGGSSPNYSTLAQAVTALSMNGVCGPVTFNIRSGTYTGQTTIGNVTGISSTNTITFQSESGDSTSTTLQFTNTTSTDCVMKLDGASFLRFKKLRFQSGGSNGSAFSFENSTHDIIISNCQIVTSITASTFTYKKLISSSGNCINFQINNNFFGGGNQGIDFGTSNTLVNDFKVHSNVFEDQYDCAIELSGVKSAKVFGNIITNTNPNTTYFGIDLFVCRDTGFVSANSIILNTGVAIRLNSSIGIDSAATFNITNNVIRGAASATVNGIQLISCSKIKVCHNTIVAGGPSTTGYTLLNSGSTNLEIKNNILYQKGSGYIIYSAATMPETDSDFNDLYSASTKFTYYNGVAQATYSAWKALGFDSLSLTILPPFVSTTDLHIAFDFSQNMLLPFFPDVPTDIEGTVRDSVSPYFGAYEFFNVLYVNDVSVKQLVSPTNNLCPGTYPVTIKMINYGTDTLQNVVLNWAINGNMQTPYNWTGILSPSDTIDVTIGNLSFTNYINYLVKAWSSLPNGFADEGSFNDTLLAPAIQPKLNGTYTIGGTSPDFSNFNQAITALNTNGICGPVIFNIRPGTYTGQQIIPAISGSSDTNTITFQSENGDSSSVIIQSSATPSYNFVIKLDGADNIRFSHLTINNTSSSSGNIFNFANSANNFAITNCQTSTASGSATSFIYTGTISVNYIFENNFIRNGNRGIYYIGDTTTANHFVIRGNVFQDQTNVGVYVKGVTSPKIMKNTIKSSVSSSTYIGLQVYNCIDTVIIEKNNVEFNSGVGIAIWGSRGGLSANILCSNNRINGLGTSSAASGMEISSTKYLKVYHNTIIANGTSTNTYAVTISSSGAVDIRNNIIFQKGAGYTFNLSDNQVSFTSDYNNVYSIGANFSRTQSNFIATFQAWQALGRDLHSTNNIPNFVSATDFHIASDFSNGLILYNLTEVPDDIEGTIRDNPSPFYGAYEFFNAPPDTIIDTLNKALVLKTILTDTFIVGSNNPITIKILNVLPTDLDTNFHKYRGTVDSLRIYYKINNGATVTETWNGSLSLHDSLIYTFNTPYYVPNGKLYTVLAWFEDLNTGHLDEVISNDSLCDTIRLPMAGSYTLGGIAPDFQTIQLSMNSIDLCGVAGQVKFLLRPGNYGYIILSFSPSRPINGSIEYSSESNNAQDVRIDLCSPGGVDSLKFSNITIVPLNGPSSTYNPYDGMRIIVKHIDFDSCVVRGGATAASRGGFHFLASNFIPSASITNCIFKDLLQAASITNHFVTGNPIGTTDFIFENNIVDSCDIGFAMYGTSLGPTYTGKWIRVRNNSFTTNQDAIDINVANSFYGMDSNIEISSNYINSQAEGISVHSNGGSQIGIRQLVLMNNMFISPLQSSSYGNAITNTHSVTLLNNTFGNSLYIKAEDSLEIYNTIFYTNDPQVTALAVVASEDSYVRADNNNYFSPANPNKVVYVIKEHIDSVNSFDHYYWITNLSQLKDSLHVDSNSVGFTPLFVSSSDLHSQSVNMKDKAKILPEVTTDIDGDSRLTDIPDIGADEINLVFGTVWPGDANNDLEVNSQDYFPIGLNFNYNGYPRDTVTDDWIAHYCNDWQQQQVNGINMMYADCNGDSTINFMDTNSVQLNYSLTHTARIGGPAKIYTADPDVFVLFDKTQYLPGDTVVAEIHIGDSINVQSNFYGTSFNVTYDPSIVVPGSETFYFNDSWLGDINQSKIVFGKLFSNAGVVDASAVRITHANTSGFGKIATLQYILKDSLSSPKMYVTIDNGVKIDNSGVLTPLIPGVDSVEVIIDETVFIKENGKENYYLVAYPNPNSGIVHIESNMEIGEIFIYDILGKLIYSQKIYGMEAIIDLNEFSVETYVLRRGKHHLRIVKN